MGTDGSEMVQDDLDIIDLTHEDSGEQPRNSSEAPVNTMDGDPGQPVAPVTDPDPGPEPKKDDGKVPSDDRTPEYIEHCCKGHLPYDPRCEVCIMGSMSEGG